MTPSTPIPTLNAANIIANQSQHQQQPQPNAVVFNYQTEKPKSQAVQRRIITFTNPPKVEFNMLKHEQYYSDPKKNAVAVKSNTDDCVMPMDLTKKPIIKEQIVQAVNKVLTPITGDANLLTTIVSINDKVPSAVTNPANPIDENLLLHDYLTERALLDAKMKQSQIKSAPPPQAGPFLGAVAVSVPEPNQTMKAKYRIFSGKNDLPQQQQSPKPVAGGLQEANFSINNNKNVLSFTKKENLKVEVPLAVAEVKEPTEVVEEESKSGMDTLAEIAAISVKLDINPETNVKRDTNDNAKSVASEYLKLTKSNKREDSESDQEVLQKPAIVVPSQPPTLPPSTQGDMNNVVARNVVVGEDGFKANEFQSYNHQHANEESSR